MGTQSSAPCKLDLSAPEFQYWRALKRVVKIWGGQGSYPEVHLNGTNTRFTQMLDLLPEPREGSWSEGARAFLKPLFGVTICPCHPTAREECRDLVFQVIRALQFTASPLSFLGRVGLPPRPASRGRCWRGGTASCSLGLKEGAPGTPPLTPGLI